MLDDKWFSELAEAAPSPADGGVSSCLKSRIYSRLIAEQESEGALEPLTASAAHGSGLCVFERLVAFVPAAQVQKYQYCKICHARVLGERVENAPIFWPNCPYSDFQRG